MSGVAACTISVPGLRENSPYIEEDDVVQLRQLRYDHVGNLFNMEHWLAIRRRRDQGDLLALDPAPGWTSIIYNGRVTQVRRKAEELVLAVSGLTAPCAYVTQPAMPQMILGKWMLGKQKLRFNVQFPVPEKRYIPMRHAISNAQQSFELDENLTTTTDSQPNGPSHTARHWLSSMLFPSEIDCSLQTDLNSGMFSRLYFDKELNYEQKRATETFCSRNYGTVPFLISGPPGTGKTKTLVEIAVQLIKNVDGVGRILFCAPSDPAADTIAQRLSAYFGPSELLRLNKPTRTFAEVSGAVLPYCYVSQNNFDLPPFRQLMSYKIVVTTCRDASMLLYARVTNSDLYAAEYGLRTTLHPNDPKPDVDLHWNALLMDESAQAIEPEALIPLVVVAPPNGTVRLASTPLFAMAGDENQLGPRTSLRASSLKTSLLARLFARPVYSAHPLARSKTGAAPPPLSKGMLPINRPPFTNLIRNYRSHPAILAIPSALFYHDTLEPEATDVNRLEGWSEWRGKRWPVLYHNNGAEDDQDMDGGGWFNTGEAQIACNYAALLVNSGLVAQKEICIMTPFKAQVACIRKTIRNERFGSLWDVDIGPTEAFQGLERGVVILCTTRSKQKYAEKDKLVDWGIIGLPNKMNVAITRAKFGLIVIGKREILANDPNWKSFLSFCSRNGLEADTNDVETEQGK